MRKRGIAVRVALCVIAATAGVLIAYRGTPQTRARAAMRPFIAEIIEKHFGQEGELAPLPAGIDYITVGRKSDGSQVRFLPIQEPDEKFTLVRDIFDVAGKDMTIYPDTQSVITDYLPPVHVGHRISDTESCPPEAYSPTAQSSRLSGYQAVRIYTERSNKRGVDRDERWVAPALGCFSLRETHIFEDGARNEVEVISIFEGEPPSSWFTAPKDYVERSPSQVAAAYAARYPNEKFATDKALILMDKAYYNHRAPQR